MKIIGSEMVADEGKKIRRKGANDEGFPRCTLLNGETEANFEEATKFEIKDNSQEDLYHKRTAELIAERYTIDDQIALLRQKDKSKEKTAEYNAFDTYAEECKAKARKEFPKA